MIYKFLGIAATTIVLTACGGGDPDRPLDSDQDGVLDKLDNCPMIPNTNQSNVDGDNWGDVCDSDNGLDADNDGVNNLIDNCPTIPNANQSNEDGDNLGDACDPVNGLDPDNDGVNSPIDNCLTISNADQSNVDGDNLGDACDPVNGLDPDNDGINNPIDNCPMVWNITQSNEDGDNLGDACDSDNGLDPDDDGVNNPIDNCPNDWNPEQNDVDGDGIGDPCDDRDNRDVDNDGIFPFDNCPNDWNPGQEDSNNNGVGDACDSAAAVNVEIPRVSGASSEAIDGLSSSIWDNAVSVGVNGSSLWIDNLVFGSDSRLVDQGPYNNWRAMHDGQFLYIKAEMYANDGVLDIDSSDYWHDDSLELFFDGNLSRFGEFDSWDDLQLIFDAYGYSQFGSASNTPTLRTEWVAAFDNGLYGSSGVVTWEIKIGLSELKVQVNQPFGFEIHLNEDLNGLDRDGKWAWHQQSFTPDNAWNDPTLFGTAILK